jgi:Protein of unknown function (DUF4238)
LSQKTKDNNHFVSEFQLKKFRCDPPLNKPGRYFVWVYEHNCVPTQKNIKIVASAHRFYGGINDALEDALANAESRYGQVYKEILSAPEAISSYGDQLSDLTWLFGFRTRALRERVRHSFVSATSAMQERILEERSTEFLERRMEVKLQERIEKELTGLNGFQKIAAKNSPAFQRKVAELRLEIRSWVRSGGIAKQFSDGIGAMAIIAKNTTVLDDELNVGIQEFLDAGGKCPANAKARHWHVVRSDSEQFVLGDCGAFALTRDGKLEPSLGIGDSMKEIYFPLSAGITAVGTNENTTPCLGEHEIIEAAVSTSFETFFANKYSADLEKSAQKYLGASMGVIDEPQLENLLDGIFSS